MMTKSTDQQKRTKRTWKFFFISFIVFAVLLSSCSYFYFFIHARTVLNSTLAKLESACRSKNRIDFQKIISKDSMYYRWDDQRINNFMTEFEKFEKSIEATSAFYIPGFMGTNFYKDTIVGHAQAKAKIDRKVRQLNNIYLSQENGVWKVMEFGFPDYIDY